MNTANTETSIQEAVHLLNDFGFCLSDEKREHLNALVRLIGDWNPRSGLCSNSELPFLWERHILDSLSLLPYFPQQTDQAGQWLDIGSGGGFPLLPCKLFLPEVKVFAIERTEKKTAYLHFAIAKLDLREITLCHGAFPQNLPLTFQPTVITARAVEKPETWAKSLIPLIQGGAVFLCQQPEVPECLSTLFHVEQINDTWSKKGLRRGMLRLIRA